MARRKGLKGVEAKEHTVARDVRKVDSGIAAVEVFTSGDVKRMERWGARKLIGHFSTVLSNKVAGAIGGKSKRKKKP